MLQPEYIGRFAPSPTGMLHMGSLLAAMASYCDAKSHSGQWLVRIEDLDPPREVIGASEKILQSLNSYGFIYDQDVVYQSHLNRQNAYQETLQKLLEIGAIYYCPCSRSELKSATIDKHLCRNNTQTPDQDFSIKIKVPNKSISFNDRVQNKYTRNLQHDCGDFVIKRKDRLFAYQIAVVVDDYYQGITNIVRGIDLIDSTPWQIYLNSILEYKQAIYAHIPVLVNSQGQKLSKQTFAKEIDTKNIIDTLLIAHSYLNQTPFLKKPKTQSDFWNHAINNWNLNNISNIGSIAV